MPILEQKEYLEAIGNSAPDYAPDTTLVFADTEPDAMQQDPNSVDVWTAAVETENTLGSWLAKWEGYPGPNTDEENLALASGQFNPFDNIPEDLKMYEHVYAEASSARHHDWITGRLRHEQRSREILSASGGEGVAAILFTAATSPEAAPMYAVPGAMALNSTRFAKLGITTMPKAMAAESVIAAGAVGISESMLHQTQERRTVEESAFAIGASAVLAPLLTGGIMALTRGRRTLIEADLEQAKIDGDPGVTSVGPRSIGAAETGLEVPPAFREELLPNAEQTVDELIEMGKVQPQHRQDEIESLIRTEWTNRSSQVKNPTLLRILGKVSPSVRTAVLPGHQARVLGAMLLSDPVQRIRHQYGQTLGAAAETMADQLVVENSRAINAALNNAWTAYKKAQKAQRGGALPDAVSPTPQLSKTEFFDAVGRAMRNNDEAADEFISKAAKDLRAGVMKPMEKQMLEFGMLKKDFEGFENVTRADLENVVEPDRLARMFDEEGNQTRRFDKLLNTDEKEFLEAQGLITGKAKLPGNDPSYFYQLWDFNKINDPTQIGRFEEALAEVIRKQAMDALDAKVVRQRELLEDLEAEWRAGDELPLPEGRTEVERKATREAQKQVVSEAKEQLDALRKEQNKLKNQLVKATRRPRADMPGTPEAIVARAEAERTAKDELVVARAERQATRREWVEKRATDVARRKEVRAEINARSKAATEAFEEAKDLRRRELLSKEDLDAARETYDAARAQVKADRAALAEEAKAFGAQRDEAMAAVEGKVKEAQKEFEKTRTQLAAAARVEREGKPGTPGVIEKLNTQIRDLDKQMARIRRQRNEKLGTRDSLEQKVADARADLEMEIRDRDAYIREALDSMVARVARDTRVTLTGADFRMHRTPKIVSNAAGPLKGRTIHLNSGEMDEWLVHNAEEVLNQWSLKIAPGMAMRRRFDVTGGDAEVETAFSDMVNSAIKEMDDMATAAERAGNLKEAKRIRKESERARKDFTGMYELMYNRYKMPDDVDSMLSKGAERLRAFNFVTMLGMMTVSAFPDIGNMIMRRGFRSSARSLGKIASWSDGVKGQYELMRKIGLAADMVNNNRAERMAMMDSTQPLTNKLDKGIEIGTNAFSKATLMPYWNAALKQFVGVTYMDDILADAMKLEAGKLPAKQLARYAQGGLGEDTLRWIAREFKKDGGGEVMDGVHLPNLENWDPELAVEFKAAIMKEADTAIVTPGKGDLPLMSRGELGKLVFQFKSFSLAANNRMLLATLDDLTAEKVAGAHVALFMGYVSYATKQQLKGQEVATDPDTTIKEAIDRSGLLSFWGDINALAEKATGGQVSAYKALGLEGEPLSRYASRNLLGAALGVSAGRVQDIGQLSYALTNGEWRETDARAMRRAIYMNNLWALHYFFSQGEDWVTQ